MYRVDGFRLTFAWIPPPPEPTGPARSAPSSMNTLPSSCSAVKPEMSSLPSSDVRSMGFENRMFTPKRPAAVSPSRGVVETTRGRPTVRKLDVRSADVSPPRAPFSPFSTETM